MKRVLFSRQFATEEMQTRFVSRRAMKMLYGDSSPESNLNMQLNSFAILPKEERIRLNLYDAAPVREVKKKRASFRIGSKRIVQHQRKNGLELEASIVDKMV